MECIRGLTLVYGESGACLVEKVAVKRETGLCTGLCRDCKPRHHEIFIIRIDNRRINTMKRFTGLEVGM